MSSCTDPNYFLVTPPNMYVHGIKLHTYICTFTYVQWNLFNDPYKEHYTPKVQQLL